MKAYSYDPKEAVIEAMKRSVVAYAKSKELRVTSYIEVLDGWKATVHANARYFEVTHDGVLGRTYVDMFLKERQVMMEDET